MHREILPVSQAMKLHTLAIFDTYLSKYIFLVSPDPGRKNWHSLKTVSFILSLGGDCTSGPPVYVMFRQKYKAHTHTGGDLQTVETLHE